MAEPGAIRHAQMASPRTAPRAELAYDGIRPGLSTVVPPGAYTGTTAWPSLSVYLKGLSAGLRAHPEMLRGDPDPKTGRAKDMVAHETFMAYAKVVAAAADLATGRGVTISKTRIAAEMSAELGRSISLTTVQRCARLAERRSLCIVTVVAARCFARAERIGRKPGREGVWTRCKLTQRGVPPVRALHTPAWLRPFMAAAAVTAPPVHNLCTRGTPSDLQGHDAAHQPEGGHVTEKSHLGNYSLRTHRGSLRSPNGLGSAQTARTKARRAPPGRERSRELVRAEPFLAQTSPRRIEHALKPFVESRPAWTVEDLQNGFGTIRLRDGLPAALPASGIENRWAYIVSLLGRLHPNADHPRLALVDPAELRCGRRDCDHGWVNVTDPGGRPAVRRCAVCRPGAWPDRKSTLDALDELDETDESGEPVERIELHELAPGVWEAPF